jgi:hypothetical protein
MARESVNDRFAPLLAAMEAAGGELPATDVRELLKIPDKRNLGRAVLPAIEAGLLHRRREGANAVYVVGADPASEHHVGEFEPVLHGDGVLVLLNCPMNANDTPQLSRAQTALVKRLLTGDLV